jgi:hypothetical protein
MLQNNFGFKIFISALLFSAFLSCNKDNNATDVNTIINRLTTDSTSILADGVSLVHITCYLDSNATPDRFGVLFKINTGTFVGSNDTTIVTQAQFIGKSLVATAVITAPQVPGSMIISAQPNLPNVQDNNYIQRDTIPIYPSIPDSISLTSSNSGINSNYGSEVTFTGTLFNQFGNKVSFGYKVEFGDSLIGSIPAFGNWRSIVDTVNSNSLVTAIYSTGSYTVGTPILISCTLLNSSGSPTDTIGITKIFINK